MILDQGLDSCLSVQYAIMFENRQTQSYRKYKKPIWSKTWSNEDTSSNSFSIDAIHMYRSFHSSLLLFSV